MRRLTPLCLAFLVAVVGLAGIAPPPAAAAGTTPVTVVLTSVNNPSSAAELVTLTATVTPPDGGATPTGSVTFKDGAMSLGTGTLDGTGKATLTTTFVTAADHSLTASYPGDTTYAAADSVARVHTVLATISRLTWNTVNGGFWSIPENWTPNATPVNGQTLVIDTSQEHNPSRHNIAGLTVGHISFVGTGTVLETVNSAPVLTLSGSIHSQASAPVTFKPRLSLADGQHVVDGPVNIVNDVAGTGGIRKTGPGRLEILSTNTPSTFAGAVDVVSGIFKVTNASSLGAAGGGVTVAKDAVLEVASEVTEDVTATDAAIVALGSGISGPVSAQGTTVTLTNALGDSGFISGVVSGPAALRKTGAGSFSLSGDNTFSGGVVAAEGGVAAAHDNALGTGPAEVEPGARLVVMGTSVANAVTVADDGVLGAFSFSAGHFTGPVTLEGVAELTSFTGTALHLDGVVSGPGSLYVANGAAVQLGGGGSNTYQGPTTVGTGPFTSTFDNNVLVLAKSGGAVAVPGSLSVSEVGRVVYAADDQLGDSAAVTVAAGGVLDPAGFDDTIGSLVSAGQVGTDDEFGTTSYHVLRMGSLEVAGTTHFEVAGTTPGASHDQLVAGSVTVGGEFGLDGYETLQRGQSVTLIDNTGSGPINGQFTGVPEGTALTFGQGQRVIVSYKGGDGNDLTLTNPLVRSGYWMMDASGKVYPFGDAQHLGDLSGAPLPAGVRPVDIEPSPLWNGYWILTSRGDVHAYGVGSIGSAVGKLQAGESATSLSYSPALNGNVWVFTDRGRAIPLNSSQHFGDMAGKALNGPVLGSVSTASGLGYFMVASDGGLFSFGDAVFRGSMGGKQLNGPVVGLAPDPDNDGYWLVANDGGIFAFNSAFKGSMGGKPLNKPVIGMVAYGDGYLMVGSDGGIFNFSSKPFKGSLGSSPPPVPVVAVAPLNEV